MNSKKLSKQIDLSKSKNIFRDHPAQSEQNKRIDRDIHNTNKAKKQKA